MRDKIIFLAKHVFSNDTEISHSSFLECAVRQSDFAMFDPRGGYSLKRG